MNGLRHLLIAAISGITMVALVSCGDDDPTAPPTPLEAPTSPRSFRASSSSLTKITLTKASASSARRPIQKGRYRYDAERAIDGYPDTWWQEALSDDGELTGRGHPWIRGSAAGIMTAVGGLGHTLPYLFNDFWTATILAVIIVFIELWVISWIRYKYMDTPFLRAAFQIAVGGFIVFLAGILIGNA